MIARRGPRGRCPENSNSPKATTSIAGCGCAVGFYDNYTLAEAVNCVSCPAGTDCDEPGLDLETLKMAEGYWRPHNRSINFLFCRLDGNQRNGSSVRTACAGGAWPGCKANTTGPYCTRCIAELEADHYYADSQCLPCSEGGEKTAITLVLLGLVLLLLLLCFVCRHEAKKRADHMRQRRQQRRASAAGATTRDAFGNVKPAKAPAAAGGGAKAGNTASSASESEDEAVVDAVEEALEEELEEVATEVGGGRGKKLAKRVISSVRGAKVKIKICVSFFQVATKLESVYGVVMPPNTSAVLEAANIINLDVFSAMPLPWACLGVGTYRNKLLAMSVAPLAIVLLILGAGAASGLQVEKASGMRSSSRRSFVRKEGSSMLRTLPFALKITFAAFPAVSSMAFQGFNCDVVDRDEVTGAMLEGYLARDLAVACAEYGGLQMPADDTTKAIMFVTIGVWTVGVPLIYVALLVKARHALLTGKPTPLSRSLSFMAGDYEPVSSSAPSTTHLPTLA